MFRGSCRLCDISDHMYSYITFVNMTEGGKRDILFTLFVKSYILCMPLSS